MNDYNKDLESHMNIHLETNPEILESLAKSGIDYMWSRCRIASNPNTPLNVLDSMADEGSLEMLYHINTNTNAPQYLKDYYRAADFIINVIINDNSMTPIQLKALSTNKFCEIREAVVGKPNTPPETLSFLSGDEVWLVRCRVAQNPNTPPKILTLMSDDEEWIIRHSVFNNPNTPQHTKEKLDKEFSQVSPVASISDAIELLENRINEIVT